MSAGGALCAFSVYTGRKAIESSEIVVWDGWEPACVSLELNRNPLQEQVLLNSELSL